MGKTDPTDKQVAYLAQLGIAPRKTRKGTQNLIDYFERARVEGGPGPFYFERVRMFKKLEAKWMGVAVYKGNVRTPILGTVIGINVAEDNPRRSAGLQWQVQVRWSQRRQPDGTVVDIHPSTTNVWSNNIQKQEDLPSV